MPIEGVWGGTGLSAARLAELVAPHTGRVHHESLSGDARLWGKRLWGKEVDDERYVLVARGPALGRFPRPAAR